MGGEKKVREWGGLVSKTRAKGKCRGDQDFSRVRRGRGKRTSLGMGSEKKREV